MAPPTSNDPFLNCMMLVLLMQVPSGKIRIGSFSGSVTCSCSLLNTAALSLDSPLSNHIWGDALDRVAWNCPRNPPCFCPVWNWHMNIDYLFIFVRGYPPMLSPNLFQLIPREEEPGRVRWVKLRFRSRSGGVRWVSDEVQLRVSYFLDLSYTLFLVLPIDSCSLPIDSRSRKNFGALSSCYLNKDSSS